LNNVISVGYYTFEGCNNLHTVTFGNNIETINSCAFRNCTSLTSITLPNSLVTIKNGAFANTGLTSITIPNSVTDIGEFTPYRNSSNTSTKVGAFEGCSALASVTLGTGLINIGNYTFGGCPISGITIPSSVKKIGLGAFHSCTSLTSIIIPNSVEYLGKTDYAYINSTYNYELGVFQGCSNL